MLPEAVFPCPPMSTEPTPFVDVWQVPPMITLPDARWLEPPITIAPLAWLNDPLMATPLLTSFDNPSIAVPTLTFTSLPPMA